MKLHFMSSESEHARIALGDLVGRYGNCEVEEAEIIVALGGDGFMLQTQHRFLNSGIPVYGMNQGTIGFLMNDFRLDGLPERIEHALKNELRPLDMACEDIEGNTHTAKAFNEVSVLRQSYQAASLNIYVDSIQRMSGLICDGMMVATPVGSTAYNLSAHGPILPLEAPLLALTPVSPFRPRRWSGALIPDRSTVEIVINEAEKRPVNAVADHSEIKSVIKVTVRQDREHTGLILFDPEHSWDERILAEQFQTG